MEQVVRPGTGRDGRRNWAELTTRVYSALIIGVISLLAAYAGQEAFAVLVALFVVGMAWEWGRLVRGRGFDAAFGLQVAATLLGAVLTVGGRPAGGLLAVGAGAAAVFVLRLAAHAGRQAGWSASGVCYIGLPAVALIWLRTDDEEGFLAILFLFVVVWMTDTAAYFSGRLIGGPRLAPWISPGKTWAGLVGGAMSAALAGGLFAAVAAGASFATAGALSLALALAAQLGDLGESAVKRMFGTKDASSLIPGHGGVLDRLDGLISAASAAALIALLRGPDHPGRALLLWSW